MPKNLLNIVVVLVYRCTWQQIFLIANIPSGGFQLVWLPVRCARKMSQRDFAIHGTKGLCLCLHYKGDNVGVHHQYFEDPDSLHLEVFSIFDWASNIAERKSLSGGYICMGSCLMYSSSRTQKVISLSVKQRFTELQVQLATALCWQR